MLRNPTFIFKKYKSGYIANTFEVSEFGASTGIENICFSIKEGKFITGWAKGKIVSEIAKNKDFIYFLTEIYIFEIKTKYKVIAGTPIYHQDLIDANEIYPLALKIWKSNITDENNEEKDEFISELDYSNLWPGTILKSDLDEQYQEMCATLTIADKQFKNKFTKKKQKLKLLKNKKPMNEAKIRKLESEIFNLQVNYSLEIMEIKNKINNSK